jgi:enediyne biosynthesis protein E4
VTRCRVVGIAAGAVVGAIVILAAGFGLSRLLPQATPTIALGTPLYVDETASSGVDHTYAGDFPYSVGGGVAVMDCDGDGRPDLYVAGGSGPAAVYRNESAIGGSLRFSKIADPAGVLTGVIGAYPIDVDADGVVDLVVLRDGENVALRGLGGCRFERANESWGVAGGDSITTAFSATWEGQASRPTLAFGNYVADAATQDPDHLCADDELVRPVAGSDRYDAPIPLRPAWCALSMLFSDWDRSGRRDLRVSNDHHYYSDLSDGQEQLWRVEPGEPPLLYTADDGWVTVRIQGMGIGSYDVNGDRYPDAYLTSQGPNVLQALLAGPSQPMYRDLALKLGVAATRPSAGGDPLPSTAWHAEFQDVNNDGFIDLLVTKGNVDQQADYASRDPSDLFLGQPGGTFVQVAEAAGIVDYARGRGAALADLNLDGLPDLVEVFYEAPVRLWRNSGLAGTGAVPSDGGHWLDVRVNQPGPNRDAIGSWIEVKVGDVTLRRELTIGGGHAGGQLGWVHFGLGPADTAEVRVQWPDGTVGPWLHAAADQFAIVERDASSLRPWSPPAGSSAP